MLAQKEQDQRNSRIDEQAGVPAGRLSFQGETCVSKGYVRTLESHLEKARARYQEDLANDKGKGEDPEGERAFWIGYCAGECFALQHAIDLLHASILHDEEPSNYRDLVSGTDGGGDTSMEQGK